MEKKLEDIFGRYAVMAFGALFAAIVAGGEVAGRRGAITLCSSGCGSGGTLCSSGGRTVIGGGNGSGAPET